MKKSDSWIRGQIRVVVLVHSEFRPSRSVAFLVAVKTANMLPITTKDQTKGDDFKPGIRFRSRITGWLK